MGCHRAGVFITFRRRLLTPCLVSLMFCLGFTGQIADAEGATFPALKTQPARCHPLHGRLDNQHRRD